MRLTKAQKKRFDEVCKKAKIKSWKKEILILCIEFLKNKSIRGKDKETVALKKVAKYILSGKK